MKRIWLGFFILLVVAAGLVLSWRAMDDEGRHAVKEQVKTWLGRNPKRLTGALPDSTMVVEHGTNGIYTGEEPPFSFAAGPWSNVVYGKDGQLLRPNLRFDFEVPEDGDSPRLSRTWAHSGSRSYRMAPGEEYSPAIRRRVGDVAHPLTSIEVGFWAWSPSSRTLLTAVVTIDRDQKQLVWFGKDLSIDADRREGQRVNGGFLLHDLDLQPADIVSVYLWKRGSAEAFIDDVDLFFHSAEVPGRTQGEPVRIDGPDPPHAIPGYADVVVTPAAVDSSRFRPGMPAVGTTLAAVPFGQGPRAWRFVPAQGVALLQGEGGEELALIRPFVDGKDATHYDRVIAETEGTGVRITGFDVEQDESGERIAAAPAPWSVQLELRGK